MLLIENGYMIDPKSGREGNYDLLIEEKKIVKIGKNLRNTLSKIIVNNCEFIDAEGLLVAPGLVDVHVHFREPGFTQKEDISSGVKAAARGGFTSVVMMANTKPLMDKEEPLVQTLEKANSMDIHVYTCANVTEGMQGQVLTDMKHLARVGAVGFTDDGIPLMDEKIVKQAMEQVYSLNMPISFHEENPSMIHNNGIHKGKASEFYKVGGSPREAEISMVERDLIFALETGASVNIQHISAKETVELIRKAKAKGKNIHAEATPHHFTLTQDAIIEYGTNAKMNPPLREEEDRQAIIQGLMDGTIDIIATDHAPHTKEEKEKTITEAPSGIIGLETALSLGITSLVSKEYLSMKDLISKMSTNPADLYHLDAGYLGEDGPADLILVDTMGKQIFEEYQSKSSNTPFTGWELQGIVKMTICNGKMIYRK